MTPPQSPPNGALSAQSDASPIELVRKRKGTPPPGERGQTHSNFYHFLIHLGRPNPDRLTVDVYRRMENDSIVRAGLQIRELAVLGKPPAFNYTPLDAKDSAEKEQGARMVAFLERVWSELRPTPVVLLRNILSARRFGFAVLEKVWATTVDEDRTPVLRTMPSDSPWAGFVWIERVKLLPPETLHRNGLSTDEYGNLLAVVQTLHHYPRPAALEFVGGSVPVVDKTNLGAVVFKGDDLRRVIVYTANLEAGNLYGTSDLKSCYNPWYSKQANLAARNILLERLSGVVVGKYENAAAQQALEDALDDIGPGSVLTVPKDSDVDILKGWEQAVEGYHRAIEYDDRQILQALLVPPLTIGGQAKETGSFARAASNFDSFLLAVRQLQLELEQVIEEHFVRPLVDANFPGVQQYPTFDFPELAEKDRQALSTVWSNAIRDGYVDPAIDAAWLRQEMGVPEDAPQGHVFQRPQPAQPPTGLPGERGLTGLPRPGIGVAAQRARDEPVEHSRFEDVEAPEANELIVEHHESLLKTRLSQVGLEVLQGILDGLPESEEGVDWIHVPEAVFRTVFEDVSREVLSLVLRDLAAKFRELGEDARADEVLELLDEAVTPQGEARLAAQAPEEALEALQAYLRYAAQFSELKGRELAETLQSRLRLRALDGYSLGLTLQEVRKRLSAEFTSYLTTQIETVSRTTIMDSFNTARSVAYEGAGDYVQGIRFLPLLDNFTTPFCRDLVNRSVAKTDPNYERLVNPPFFHNCRTITVPILAGEEWEFDTDWDAWLSERENVDGGGFLFGKN